MNTSEIRARALAVLVGAALFLFLPATLGALLGDDTALMLPVLIAAYSVSGVLLGILWPAGGWRLGLYLFAIWPPMLLFALFLGGEALIDGPVHWKGMLRDLLGYLLILVVSCVGAELGAIIKGRWMVDSSPRT